MDWTVYNFECTDPDARDRFLDYFDREHPVDVPEDDEAVHEEVRDAAGETQGAEYAWLPDHDYLYVTSLAPVEGVLDMTAEYWDRAVEASFDSTTESLRTATLYESTGDDPVAVGEYDGLPERGGAGLLWRLAVEEGFRFRAYSKGPPTTITFAPITSTYDVIPEENLEEFVTEFEEATGVDRTAEAMDALRDDPAKDYEPSDEEDDGGTTNTTPGTSEPPADDTASEGRTPGPLGRLRNLLGL